jgi:N-acetylglucosaminyldiphosphoundecaprenol N-acetyl-beta-D-mannosaminyltransferase
VRFFAGVPFLESNLEEAANLVIQHAMTNQTSTFHLVNAYSIAAASENAQYKKVLTESKTNFADGFPISLLTKFSTRPLSQVRGPDLFREVIRRSESAQVKHFFLGGSNEVLELIVDKIHNEYPLANVAGIYSPPFRELNPKEREEQAKKILDSGANLVWVALGTPKQDIEASRLALETGKTVAAVGAAFDFFAGTTREAPHWIAGIGLEWAFRLFTEPRRLWRRYLVGNFKFLGVVAKNQVSSK